MTYRPHTHLAAMTDVTYLVTPLPEGKRTSWWFPLERGIVVAKHLVQRDRRSQLAHELGHAEDDDTCVEEYPNLERAQERRVNERAARNLIPIKRLAEVLAPYDAVAEENISDIAEELHVSDEMLRFRITHLHPTDEGYLRRRHAERETSA